MIPFLSDSSQASKRIRRNNSGKYYGEIPSIDIVKQRRLTEQFGWLYFMFDAES